MATTTHADDVTNLPTGEVENPGPVTTRADWVPDDGKSVSQPRKAAAKRKS